MPSRRCLRAIWHDSYAVKHSIFGIRQVFGTIYLCPSISSLLNKQEQNFVTESDLIGENISAFVFRRAYQRHTFQPHTLRLDPFLSLTSEFIYSPFIPYFHVGHVKPHKYSVPRLCMIIMIATIQFATSHSFWPTNLRRFGSGIRIWSARMKANEENFLAFLPFHTMCLTSQHACYESSTRTVYLHLRLTPFAYNTIQCVHERWTIFAWCSLWNTVNVKLKNFSIFGIVFGVSRTGDG